MTFMIHRAVEEGVGHFDVFSATSTLYNNFYHFYHFFTKTHILAGQLLHIVAGIKPGIFGIGVEISNN